MLARNSAVIVLVALALAGFAAGQDISALLNNPVIVKNEINCVLKRGRCDIIGRQIVALLPEALNNNCRRCTPTQRQQSNQLMTFMKQNYPQEWSQILKMYSKPRSPY